MSAAPRGFDAFVKSPDPAIRLILLYGDDPGLIRERGERAMRAIVPDPNDPFRTLRLTVEAMKEDPARLADEAAAIPLGGGRRAIRIADAGNLQAKAFGEFLERKIGDALVVVEAQDLRKTDPLVKTVEAFDHALVVTCYRDDGAGVDALIGEALAAAKLTATDGALAYLESRLGADRILSRRELYKLVTYVGPGRAAPITLEEVQACIDDAAAIDGGNLAMAVAEGDHAMVLRSIDRLVAEGEGAIALLRIVGRHYKLLHDLHVAMAGGQGADLALKRVFWKIKERVRRQVRLWSPAAIAEAMRRLNDAEAKCKTTGMTDLALATHTLAGLATAAQALLRRQREREMR